jgi:drug/metabolite transporter (DMT)-like permease
VHPPQRPLLALAFRIGSVSFLSTLLMLVKLAGDSGVALPEIMFWRQFLTVPLVLALLAATGELDRLKTQRLGSHAARAMSGMTGMVCNFGATILLPLAVSTTLGFTTPLFAVILTALFLKDRVGPWRWAAVVLGFAGVLVIAQPGQASFPPLGTALGLLSGLLVAAISFQVKDLARTEEPIRVVFYFALFGSAVMALALPFYMTAHTAQQWLLLLGCGLCGLIGQLFLTASLRHGAVASVIVMDYLALIWATLYGWAIWAHLPSTAMWLGAPLIIAAGMLITWREHKLARRLSPNAPSAVE